LDLCCGEGRHALRLAALGYNVTDVDQSDLVAPAGFRFIRRDMRGLHDFGPFDGVISMWQSFGYFSDTENRQLLRSIASQLNPCGRLVLDIYNREFFENHQGTREFTRAGVTIIETKRMAGGRLSVSLDYGGGQVDRFEWQVYTQDEIRAAAGEAGLARVLACTSFDETQPPSAGQPRMQLVFECV
jgi:SAM-dependent methyltransferase